MDPIDGTKSFISGALKFWNLNRLLKNGRPIIGVINHPILNELLIGDNQICLLNEKKVKIRNCFQLIKQLYLQLIT